MRPAAQRPARGRRSRVLAPDELLAAALASPLDRALVVAGMCVRCRATAEAIRACADTSCPARRLRPFQRDVPARGAPHIARPDHGLEKPEPHEANDEEATG